MEGGGAWVLLGFLESVCVRACACVCVSLLLVRLCTFTLPSSHIAPSYLAFPCHSPRPLPSPLMISSYIAPSTLILPSHLAPSSPAFPRLISRPLSSLLEISNIRTFLSLSLPCRRSPEQQQQQQQHQQRDFRPGPDLPCWQRQQPLRYYYCW